VRGQVRGSFSKSCGISWTGETPQEQSDEEAQRQPRGKRSAWNGNQQTPFQIQQNFKKTLDKLAYHRVCLQALLKFINAKMRE